MVLNMVITLVANYVEMTVSFTWYFIAHPSHQSCFMCSRAVSRTILTWSSHSE